jgi:uncharacterized membrane protein
MKVMPTVFGGAGFGVFTITAGTRIPARIPGTTKRTRGSGTLSLLSEKFIFRCIRTVSLEIPTWRFRASMIFTRHENHVNVCHFPVAQCVTLVAGVVKVIPGEERYFA